MTKIQITRQTTVAEAFALAGCEPPEKITTLHYDPVNDVWACNVSDGNSFEHVDFFYFLGSHNRQMEKLGGDVSETDFFEWHFETGRINDLSLWDYVSEVNLRNLPAVDAWDALPAVVRDQLEVVG